MKMNFKFIFLFFGVFYFLCWITPFAQGKNIPTPLKNLDVTEKWIKGTKFEDNFLGKSESSDAASKSSKYPVQFRQLLEKDESQEKFVSMPSHITLEQTDYVQTRLNDIAQRTTSNITQLREVQKSEFEVNLMYKDAWEEAAMTFYNSTKTAILPGLPTKSEILKGLSHNSLVRKLPDEYHIALIAYSTVLYRDFNKETREVCSGPNVDDYKYKSYFKLLMLAIEALSKEPKFRTEDRFLYRGVNVTFSLEIGQVLAFQHFVSTSNRLDDAQSFAGKTLLEVHGDFSSSAISLKTHSVYPAEDEVFVSPFEIYKVKSKHQEVNYTRYVLIKHKISQKEFIITPAPYSSASTIYNKSYVLVFLVIFLNKL